MPQLNSLQAEVKLLTGNFFQEVRNVRNSIRSLTREAGESTNAIAGIGKAFSNSNAGKGIKAPIGEEDNRGIQKYIDRMQSLALALQEAQIQTVKLADARRLANEHLKAEAFQKQLGKGGVTQSDIDQANELTAAVRQIENAIRGRASAEKELAAIQNTQISEAGRISLLQKEAALLEQVAKKQMAAAEATRELAAAKKAATFSTPESQQEAQIALNRTNAAKKQIELNRINERQQEEALEQQRKIDRSIGQSFNVTKTRLRETQSLLGAIGGRIGSFLLRFTAFTLAASILTRAFFSVQQSLTGMVQRGLEFNKSMENTQLAFAAILTTSRELVNAQGQVADIASTYPIFLGKARQFYKELLFLNIETLGTGQELQGVFQRVLAFSQDQNATDKERLLLTQNILNASKLLGLTGEQANVEARQLLTLERDQGQTILQSLGLRAKELRQYKEQGTLVQELNKRLQAYSIIAKDTALTFEGLTSTVTTFIDGLAGAGFEQTFDGLKIVLRGISKELEGLFRRGGIASALGLSFQDLEELGKSVGRIMASGIQFIADATNAVIRFAAENREALLSVGNSYSFIGRIFGEFSKSIGTTVIVVGQLGVALSRLGDLVPDFLKNGAFQFKSPLDLISFGSSPFGGAAPIKAVREVFVLLSAEANQAQVAIDFIGKRLPVISGEIANLPKLIEADPRGFAGYLKQIKEIQEELNLLRKSTANIPEPIREQHIENIHKLEDALSELTSQFERAKNAATLFSEEALKGIDKGAELLRDAQEQLAVSQEDLRITQQGIAQGLSDEQIDILKRTAGAVREVTKAQKLGREEAAKVLGTGSAALRGAGVQSSIVSLRPLPAHGGASEDVRRQVAALDEQRNKLGEVAKQTEEARLKDRQLLEAREEGTKAVDRRAEAERDLAVIYKDVVEKTAQANRQFQESVANFGKVGGVRSLEAQLTEVEAEIDEILTRIAEKTKGAIPENVANQVATLLKIRKAEVIASSLGDEKRFVDARTDLAQEELRSIEDKIQSEINVRKELTESRKADLEQLLSEGERSAGVFGKANGSLQERARLIEQIGQLELSLIQEEIVSEEAKIKTANDTIVSLQKSIAELSTIRDQRIADLKDLGLLDEGTRSAIESGFKRDTEAIERSIQAQKNAANESGAAIRGLRDSAGRAISDTKSQISELGETIINLNDPIANLFGNLADGFTKGGNILKNIGNTFKSFGNDIQRSLSDAFRESIKKKLNFDQVFKGNILDLGGFFKSTFSEAVDFVGNLFGGFGSKISSASGGFFSGIGNLFSGLFGGGSGSGGGGSPLSFLGNIFGGGTGSGGGIASTVSRLFGGGGGVSPATGGGAVPAPVGFLGNLFGGGGAGGGTPSGFGVFLPGQGGAGGGFANPIANQSFQVPQGTVFSQLPGGGGGANLGGGITGGFLGNSFGEGFGKLLGLKPNLGSSIGGGVGGAIGFAFGGPLGAGIGSFVGNLIGGAIGSLFEPGRIEKEKKNIIKTIKPVVPDAKIRSESKAAGGLRNLPEVEDALLALGVQFTSQQKKSKSNQGTAIRFAGQLAANLTGDAADAKRVIEELAQSLQLDLGSGIAAINKSLDDNVLSFKNFQKEMKDARKNLKQYGDTSNLTAKELSELALANGNTGSKILTVNEALAGVIDITTGFDSFISGATIANNYLADSFADAAKEGNLFNEEMQRIAEEIRKGNLSLEEGAIALNKLRESVGLAALKAKDFSIDAEEIQRQIDIVKKAVDSLRSGISSALSLAIGKELKPGDVAKAFRKSIYQTLVDTIVEGFTDGFIKGSGAAEVLTQAFAGIGSVLNDFVEGSLTEEEAFSKVGVIIEEAKPKIEKIADLLGVSADYLRDMLSSTGLLNELLDEAAVGFGSLAQQINDSAKSAFVQGVIEGQSSEEIITAFKRDFYTAFVSTVAEAFIEGSIKGLLSEEVIEASQEMVDALIKGFREGTISRSDFALGLGEVFTAVKANLDEVSGTIGVVAEEWNRVFSGTEAEAALRDTLNQAEALEGFAATLSGTIASAIVDGINNKKTKEEIEQAIRTSFYQSIFQAVVQGFTDGIVKAALATGPLKAVFDQINTLIQGSLSGDITGANYQAGIREAFAALAPEIKALAQAGAIAAEEFLRIAEDTGIYGDLLNEQLNALANEAKATADSLRQAAKDLLLDSSLSPLKPKERLTTAKTSFEVLRQQALAGDQEAAKQLPEAGRQLLEEARKVLASSKAYEDLFDFVRGSLLDVADSITLESDIQERQLRTLEEIRDEIRRANGIQGVTATANPLGAAGVNAATVSGGSTSAGQLAQRQALPPGFVAPGVPYSPYTQPGTFPQTVDVLGLKPKFGSSGSLDNPPSAYTAFRLPGQTLEDAYNANYHGTDYAAWGNPLSGNTFVGYNTQPTQPPAKPPASATTASIIAAANGFSGVVDQPQLFLAGESGPELVNINPLSATNDIGSGRVTLLDNGGVRLRLDTSDPTYTRDEADLFLGAHLDAPNFGLPEQIQSIAEQKSLNELRGLRLKWSQSIRQLEQGSRNEAPFDYAGAVFGLEFISDNGQKMFYQLWSADSRGAPPTGWFDSDLSDGFVGFNDSVQSYGLSQQGAGSTANYNLDVFDRFRGALAGAPIDGLNKNLAQWKLRSVYAGPVVNGLGKAELDIAGIDVLYVNQDGSVGSYLKNPDLGAGVAIVSPTASGVTPFGGTQPGLDIFQWGISGNALFGTATDMHAIRPPLNVPAYAGQPTDTMAVPLSGAVPTSQYANLAALGLVAPGVPYSQYTLPGTFPQTVDVLGLAPKFGSSGALTNPPSAYDPFRRSGQTLEQAFNANYYGTDYAAWGNPLHGNTFIGYNVKPTEAFSLANGGIVTAPEVPAMLHGPEAVIPLPHGTGVGGGISVSSPELVDEIKALRRDLNSLEESRNRQPIEVHGDVHLGEQRVGKFIDNRVQQQLNRQQIRVPRESLINSRVK